ncbi:MAG: gamma carbonic anhydrase family protein [Desulfosarcinaceae bacterium]|jgi:carbonic anhydrase/acetyltransferase-like protein (isoleucine patch superfamily)
MMLPYEGKTPRIHPSVFVAPTAVIIGAVEIAAGASVWFGAVLRGDLAPIRIGARTNIQDNCTIHVDIDTPAIIGDGVTIGHNAVVHGCTIEDHCLIGMGALVLNQAWIGSGSIIAAGAVVTQESRIGPEVLAAGTPAVVKKSLDAPAVAGIRDAAAQYCDLVEKYRRRDSL